MITDPSTGKRLQRVFVKGKGWFRWNSAYHVYNSTQNYDQLQETDKKHIDFSA